MATSPRAAALSVALLTLAACGGGPTAEEAMRSQREFELGVGLMREGAGAQAFAHLLHAVRLDPDNGEAHHVLGVLYTARGDYADADRHLREALRVALDPDLTPRPGFAGEVRNSLGVLRIHERKYDEAVRVLTEAAGDLLYTTPYLAWANLGLAHFEAGRTDEAIAAYQRAVALQRDFCLGYLRLGQALLAAGRMADAEAALTRVVEVDNPVCNTTQDAWRMRGEARLALGHGEDATHDLERCVELGPETDIGQRCRRALETHAP
jgi:Tfp pilus assembly protein PilF